jgi:O-antigen ligase
MRQDKVRHSIRGNGRSSTSLTEQSANLLDRFLFAGLLVTIVLASIPYGTAEPWWQAVFECAIYGLTAIWILEVLLRGSWQVKRLFILLPMIVMTAYAFGQTIEWPAAWAAIGNGQGILRRTLTIDRYQTYLTARKTLALTLFFGLLLLQISTPARLRWLVRVVIGLGLASAVFGILRQLLQSPDSTTGFVLPYLFYGMGYGQFLSPNAFAYLMGMSFALVGGVVLGGAIRRDRILIYLAIALFIWTALVLSNSRGGIFGLVCQSIFLLLVSLNWYSSRRIARLGSRQHGWRALRAPVLRMVLIVLIVGTLIGGVVWMGGDQLAFKMAQRSSVSNEELADGTTRKQIWQSTWALIKQNPWTGVGFGAYFLAISQYQMGSGRIRVEQAHNDYLDLAANGGVIAVALAVWFIAMVGWRARFSLRSADTYRRAASLGAAAGILDVGVHSLVDFGLQVTGLAVVFAALIVILVADIPIESRPSERKGATSEDRQR